MMIIIVQQLIANDDYYCATINSIMHLHLHPHASVVCSIMLVIFVHKRLLWVECALIEHAVW